MLTAEEIAKRRELARIKNALKYNAVKVENSETVPNVTIENIEENKPETVEPTQNENDIMFIAFGRIYSGTIRRGQEMYVLGPKHDPSKTNNKVFFISQMSIVIYIYVCMYGLFYFFFRTLMLRKNAL